MWSSFSLLLLLLILSHNNFILRSQDFYKKIKYNYSYKKKNFYYTKNNFILLYSTTEKMLNFVKKNIIFSSEFKNALDVILKLLKSKISTKNFRSH